MWGSQQSKRSDLLHLVPRWFHTSSRCQTWNCRVCVCVLLTFIIALLVLHTFLLFKWEWCLQNEKDQDLLAANRSSVVTPDTQTISRKRPNSTDALHLYLLHKLYIFLTSSCSIACSLLLYIRISVLSSRHATV